MYVIIQILQNELKPILKRTAQAIFDRGGVIRKINNLGTNTTPYKMSMGGTTYKQARYWRFFFINLSTMYIFYISVILCMSFIYHQQTCMI